MTRRRVLIVVAATAVTLSGASLPAWAYFTASATSTVTASATSLVAVTAPGASGTTSTSTTITWTDNSNPAVTTYTVAAGGTTYCSGQTARSCSIIGLSDSTAYSFTVTPILQGWSGPSASVPVTTLTPPPPSAAGLGISITGGTGTIGTCGPISANYTCNITGTAKSGSVGFNVSFVSSGGTPVAYSSTQSSTITGSGTTPASVSIAANQTTSTGSFTVTRPGNSSPTATLTFGTTFKLTVNVTGPNS